MKLIGGDSGRCEHEERVDSVLLAPSERAVVDVLFPTPGSFPLEHRTPDRAYRLGTIHVAETAPQRSFITEFEALHSNMALTPERKRFDEHGSAAPTRP